MVANVQMLNASMDIAARSPAAETAIRKKSLASMAKIAGFQQRCITWIQPLSVV
jgi:hypothetical protein